VFEKKWLPGLWYCWLKGQRRWKLLLLWIFFAVVA
jgi:hypothetical protein